MNRNSKQNKEVTKTGWNLAKEGGWKKYEEVTNSFKDKLEEVVDDEDSSIEEKYTKFNKQTRRTEEEIERLKKHKGRLGRIWEMRKVIVGGKVNKMQANAIINPKSGKLEVAKERIKEVTLQHCIDMLENNKAEDEFEKEIEKRKLLQSCHKRRLVSLKQASKCLKKTSRSLKGRGKEVTTF